MAIKSARQHTVELLLRMERDEAYSNILLDHALRDIKDDRDKAFTSALFYGVLERRITLDHIISRLSSIPMRKLAPEVLQILRIGLYQLLYMEHVPDSAAVNESVRLTQLMRKASAKGFVNAILRGFIRAGKKLDTSKLRADEVLSVQYSCPLWLVQKWQKEYSAAEDILAASLGRPPLAVRVNTMRTSTQALTERFEAVGMQVKRSDALSDALLLEKTGGLERTDAYQEGLFHVQDISSQLCCDALGAQAGEVVLDLCAAPGGKSFTIAQRMKDSGKVLSFDLHAHRTALIENGAKRLGLECIEARTSDAAVYDQAVPMADRVLCDVPCSGLGIIRRKPEIKYKPASAHDELPTLQLEILQNAARYVKIGGVLQYSTCTLSRAENDAVVDAFLQSNPAYKEDKRETLLPKADGGDGFFFAKLVRIGV